MLSTTSQTHHEKLPPDGSVEIDYQSFEARTPLHTLDFMDFFSNAAPSLQPNIYHDAVDVLSGYDWIFSDSADEIPTHTEPATASTIPSVTLPSPPRPRLEQNLSSTQSAQQGFLGAINTPAPSEQLEHGFAAVPEDRWPKEWYAVPLQESSLPALGRPGVRITISRYFDLPRISNSVRADILSLLRQTVQRSPQGAFSLDHFPSGDTLDCCVDLYFAHFHQVTDMMLT